MSSMSTNLSMALLSSCILHFSLTISGWDVESTHG
jgi:hypothetical protein